LLSLCAGLDDVNFQLPLHLPPDLPLAERASASRGSFAAAVGLAC